MPFALVLLLADSGNRSGKLPGIGKEDRIVQGVGQHWHRRLGKRKGTGRILETAGSPGDLESQSAMALVSREIYAIVPVRETELQ